MDPLGTRVTTATIERPAPAAAAPAAEPHDVVVQSVDNSHQFGIITPIELTGAKWPKKRVPRGEDRIDAVNDVLNMQKVWDQGYTGKGVTVAVIDTGCHPHEDYADRMVAWKDCVNDLDEAYDDNGHGTHCAGLVLGDGKMAGGRFKGPAYEANLVGIKVLSREGGGTMSDVIRGIEWAVENKQKYNIKVISMSLGGPAFQKEKHDLVAQAIEKAYAAGIVPVVAAGNSGPYLGTIGTPAVSSFALTVGAYDDKNTADRQDDTMAYFSSRGPTIRDMTLKPDIATPGVQLVSALSPTSMLAKENVPKLGDKYVLLSGTSMATPVMAGIVAVMLQANPNLTPGEVIDIVKSTADPIPMETSPLAQGAGLANPEKCVAAALARAQKKTSA